MVFKNTRESRRCSCLPPLLRRGASVPSGENSRSDNPTSHISRLIPYVGYFIYPKPSSHGAHKINNFVDKSGGLDNGKNDSGIDFIPRRLTSSEVRTSHRGCVKSPLKCNFLLSRGCRVMQIRSLTICIHVCAPSGATCIYSRISPRRSDTNLSLWFR